MRISLIFFCCTFLFASSAPNTQFTVERKDVDWSDKNSQVKIKDAENKSANHLNVERNDVDWSDEKPEVVIKDAENKSANHLNKSTEIAEEVKAFNDLIKSIEKASKNGSRTNKEKFYDGLGITKEEYALKVNEMDDVLKSIQENDYEVFENLTEEIFEKDKFIGPISISQLEKRDKEFSAHLSDKLQNSSYPNSKYSNESCLILTVLINIYVGYFCFCY